MNKYKFDDACERVYFLRNKQYVFENNYISCGINANMSYKRKSKIINKIKDEENAWLTFMSSRGLVT